MHLDKTQIKRILRDHCQHQIREKEKDIAIDYIAQTIIEHEKEIVKEIPIKNQIFNRIEMIRKFIAKE